MDPLAWVKDNRKGYKNRYLWTNELDEKIMNLYDVGKSTAAIKKALDFPGQATTIRERLSKLGKLCFCLGRIGGYLR